MTLRSQIHRAIDDVAPPAPTLERRVKAFVLSDEPDRKHLIARRQPRWVAPLGLIAAALVLALVAGLFIGGRFWRTQNAPPSTVGQAELRSLEFKPLNFPTVAPGAPCPTTPKTLGPNGLYIGHPGDRVGVYDTEIFQSTNWGEWIEIAVAYIAPNEGLVLIRARDLKAGAEVVFANYPLAPTGISTAGQVLGQEHALDHDLKLRSEAVFRDPAHTHALDNQGHLPELLVLVGLQQGSSGCIGFQIDGPGFTENLVLGP